MHFPLFHRGQNGKLVKDETIIRCPHSAETLVETCPSIILEILLWIYFLNLLNQYIFKIHIILTYIFNFYKYF
jgi:hypothetical protein